MLKTGKKIVLLVLALALALSVLAGCSGGYTGSQVKYDEQNGGKGAEATSNGGFIVEKGGWLYFINGVASAADNNTYGDVVEGALMRISVKDAQAGKNTAEIVVPELMVAQDFNAGIFIYGDEVYYATPNTYRNMDGEVETSYLNYKSAKLDGSAMKEYYVQVDDNSTQYRYVLDKDENGNEAVYLVYAGTDKDDKSTLYSYNTETGVTTALVTGYSEFKFDETDLTNPVIYYTMPVIEKDTYSASSKSGTEEGYQQLYRVNAAATSGPLADVEESEEFLSAYTDKTADENDEYRTMKYTNLGTLVLDGIDTISMDYSTPFNLDLKEGVTPRTRDGFKYSVMKYAAGQLVLSVTSGDNVRFYTLEDETYVSDKNWNSITANGNFADDSQGNLTPLATTSDRVSSSAIYYKEGDAQYYLYLGGDGAIYRVKVAAAGSGKADYVEEETIIARQQTGATLLFIDNDFLYFSQSGTNGNALCRVKYDGNEDNYDWFNSENYSEDYTVTKYLELDYNSSWYKPELIEGTLFFPNAESYAQNYIYAMANPADNKALEELNDIYEAVFDAFDDIAVKFSDASNLAKYYYYGGDMSIVEDKEGEHYNEYREEDFKVFEAFKTCEENNAYNLDFSGLKDEEGNVYNTRGAFYKMIGQISEDDQESNEESLKTDLLLTEAKDDEEDAWTWQWAAIFVPVGVVVLAGAAVATVFIVRRKRK